ncbi:MAG: hypothetical protein AAGI72_23635 [Pseudomonadota bacterium]
MPDLGARGQAQNNAYKGPYAPPVSLVPDLTYLGGFQLEAGEFGGSDLLANKGAFSVYHGEEFDEIVIAGNRNKGRHVGTYRIPALAQNPADAIAPNETPFIRIANVQGQHLTQAFKRRNPDTGEEWFLASNAIFYTTKDDDCNVFVFKADGTGPKTCYAVWAGSEWAGLKRQLYSGSIFEAPDSLADALGGHYCIHPEHWLNNISRVSAGPGLSCFDMNIPRTPTTIRVNLLMTYPYDQTVGQHGSSSLGWEPDEGLWRPIQRQSNPIFGRLARYEGCFFWEPTDAYVCVGTNGGQEYGDWYGPRGNQPKTHVQRGTHTGHPDEMPTGVTDPNCDPSVRGKLGTPRLCVPQRAGQLRGLRDMKPYVWVTRISDILDAAQPWSPEPVEWGYLNSYVDKPVAFVSGAYFDEREKRLYIIHGPGIVTVYQVG